MDYLPNITVEPAHRPFIVPYLCARDIQPQHAYGDDTEELWTQDNDTLLASGISPKHIAALLQEKLFLGLVRELYRELDSAARVMSPSVAGLDSSDFSVEALPALLEHLRFTKLLNHRPALSVTMKSRLQTAAANIRKVIAKLELDYIKPWEGPDLWPLPVIILSIQALIETIWDAQFPPVVWPLEVSTRHSSPFFIENGFVSSLLRNSGWLSNEIVGLPKDIRIRYYLSFFRQRPVKSRRRASINQRPFVKDYYSASHVDEGCKCPSLSATLPDGEDLEALFTLVCLHKTADGEQLKAQQVAIHSSTGRPKFVAFSHVRSDGLGSSTSNSLPRCQLLFLQKLGNELLPNEPAPVHFYMDTLAVPLKGPAKRSALRNLQHIFRIADEALVLDSDLSTIPIGNPQENLTRIRYSLWAKRLWTVQECAVTPNANFRFLDHNLSLNTLLSSIDTDTEFPLLRTQSLKDRNLNGFTDQDYERLSTALRLLSDDMQLAESLNVGIGQYEGYDKSRLRTVLRLGLLALPHMRYFSEAHESVQFQTVASGLLLEYASVNEDRELGWEAVSRDPSALYTRLEKVQNLKLTVY